MAFPDDLRSASYSGVSFLCNVTEITGGIKSVVHEFPNSRKQFVENLGLRPRTYSLTAIISDQDGSDYLRKRDDLFTVLEAGIPQILNHPFYGLLTNIIALNFTGREQTTRLGDTEIDIQFALSDSIGTPILAQISASVLRGLLGKISNSTVASIVEAFIVRGSDNGNILDATNILGRFVDVVRDGLISTPIDTSLLDVFTRQIDQFEIDIPALIFNPSRLGAELTTNISDMAALYPNPNDKIRTMKEFNNFGIDDVSIPQDTAARLQRQINRDTLNDAVNVMSLSESYVAGSQIEFGNINEINETEELLETQYRFIVG